VVLVLVAFAHSATIGQSDDESSGEKTSSRDAKFIKLFDLIEFSNTNCLSDSGSEVGTCFTETECSANQGKPIGSCAKGFGVCCQYIRSCDMDTCYNNTYFQNTQYPSGHQQPGMCMMSIHRQPASSSGVGGIGGKKDKVKGTTGGSGYSSSQDIKCIKLEFEDFDIRGPSNGDCTNDTFTVTGGGMGQTIPVLCGVNTGNFMYIDTRNTPGPYKLNFNFGRGSSSARPVGVNDGFNNGFNGGFSQEYSRRWRIRVIQYAHESQCPPRNCLQYFTEPMGTVCSFNNVNSLTTSNGALQSQGLTNLDYAVCFKNHDGLCDVALSSDMFDWGNSPCKDRNIGFMGHNVCGTAFTDTQLNRTGLLAFQVFSDGDNSDNDAGFKIDYMQKAC